ncbi:uncharacterized protein RAG0_13192 [Rhynchosporium agropyri]|uniref:Uncharacterized protein n=1 Tax=Rhynchosporium agropyri TaxID=914238 RepID=A0A1E1LBH6_9HELO|nr:uncharacterized protein RAG0_13192 [Rhynchosporium agropyri]
MVHASLTSPPSERQQRNRQRRTDNAVETSNAGAERAELGTVPRCPQPGLGSSLRALSAKRNRAAGLHIPLPKLPPFVGKTTPQVKWTDEPFSSFISLPQICKPEKFRHQVYWHDRNLINWVYWFCCAKCEQTGVAVRRL